MATTRKTSSKKRTTALSERSFVPLMRCPRCGGPPKKGRKPKACFACQSTGYIVLPGDVADALSRERGGPGLPRHARLRADRVLEELATFPPDREDADAA